MTCTIITGSPGQVLEQGQIICIQGGGSTGENFICQVACMSVCSIYNLLHRTGISMCLLQPVPASFPSAIETLDMPACSALSPQARRPCSSYSLGFSFPQQVIVSERGLGFLPPSVLKCVHGLYHLTLASVMTQTHHLVPCPELYQVLYGTQKICALDMWPRTPSYST